MLNFKFSSEQKMLQDFTKKIGAKSFDNSCYIKHMDFIDERKNIRHIWHSNEEMSIRLSVKTKKRLEHPDIKISFERLDGNILMQNSASEDDFAILPIDGEAIFEIRLGKISFGESIYEVHCELLDLDDRSKVVAEYNDVIKILNPEGIVDYPAFFTDIEWNNEYLGCLSEIVSYPKDGNKKLGTSKIRQ